MTYVTVFDERPNADCEDLHARAAEDGYIPGAHLEQDKDHTLGKHKDKTKHQQVIDLEKYIAWHLYVMKYQGSPVTRDVACEQMLCKGAELPSFENFMDFGRYFIAASKGGKIDVSEDPKKTTPQDSKDKKNKTKKKLTLDSFNSSLERIFAGWERHTKGEVPKEFRSRAYNHARDVFCRVEGLLVDVKKPKHNFGPTDLDRLQRANVERVDNVPGLYIIQFLAVMGLYFVTGARIGAFFDEGGLRWKDLWFVLKSVPEGGWHAFYQVMQRYVKNNRSPEHNYFGAAGRQHSRLLYNETAMLLVLAILQQVLVGIDTLQDLFEQEIDAKEKYRDLLIEDWAKEKFVLRKVDPVTGKMTDEPMPKSAFLDIFRRTFLMSGSVASPSIHAIRRGLGKYVGERYTQVELAQHLTQGNVKVFGQSYVANCSSVDGISAFLGEERQTEHVDYFQGLERFHEEGLPNNLPAAREAAVLDRAPLRDLKNEIDLHAQSAGSTDAGQLKKLRAHYQSERRRVLREELKEYQTQWIRERRAWKVRTKGKVKSELPDISEAFHNLSLISPERGRIASLMRYEDPVEGPLLKQAMQDLLLVAGDDRPVLYLPNLEPREGRWCPVASCGQDLNTVQKNMRCLHIQACRRRELASEHTLLAEEVHYCYPCYDWVCGSKVWEQHCDGHLADWRSKACGTLTHRHTVHRLAYCEWCLSDETLPASERLKGFSRNDNKQRHVADKAHLDSTRFPAPCPHMVCRAASDPEVFETREAFENHRTDVHGAPRSTPRGPRSKKRESSEDTTDSLVWRPLDSPAPKKARLSAPKAEPADVPTRSAATVQVPAAVAVEVDIARQVPDTMSAPRRVSECATQREKVRFVEADELPTSPVAPTTIDLRGPEEVELPFRRHVPPEPSRLATHLTLGTSALPSMKRSESPDQPIAEIAKPSSTHGKEECASWVGSQAATEPIHRAYQAPRSGIDPPFRPRRTCAQNKLPFSRRFHGSGGSTRRGRSRKS